MEITFNAYITVGKEDYDYIKKDIVAEIELTKKDLEEFVKEQGYDTPKDYFMAYINEGSKEENEQYYEQFIAPYLEINCDLLETEIHVMCGDEKALNDFMSFKYKNKFNRGLLAHLTQLNLDYDIRL